MGEQWPVESLLPHRGPMLFLERVVSYTEDWILCEVNTANQADFARTSLGIPAWFGLEYMCQSIAALEGIKRLEKKERTLLSFIMGSRKITSEMSYLPRNERLTIRAETEIRDNSSAIGVFRCEIFHAHRCIMQGMIKGYMPESSESIFNSPR